jgi:hypothetical protein
VVERGSDAPAEHELVLVAFGAPGIRPTQAENMLVIEEGAELLDIDRVG